MDDIKTMKAVLNDFIKSLPDFIERAKSRTKLTCEWSGMRKLTFEKSGMRMIAYQGELTAPTLEQWCNLMVKHGIPFADGETLDFHNDMYLGWKTRFSMVYLNARYVPYKLKHPIELTWCMLTTDIEPKDGEHDEV